MKRKVVRHGSATLTISLPSKWAKKFDIKQGDELEIEEEGSSLAISTEKYLKLNECEFVIDPGTISYIRSIISNSYKKGYDVINLKFEEPNVIVTIQKVVDGLLGYEIVEQGQGYCIIKNVASGLETEFESMLKKSFFMTLTMGEICLEDINNKKLKNYEEIRQMKDNITKFTNFCKRLTNKAKKNLDSNSFAYLILWSLEKIANEYKYIYRYLSKHTTNQLSKKTLDYFKNTNQLLRLYFDGFYKKDNKMIKNITTLKDQYLYKDLYDVLKQTKHLDSVVIHHLANIIRRVYDMTGPYFGIYL
ncbi:MAG: AbrB/MazE/SpoVT family DNA-binding domain-containing protein [Nanoarchaeota archaeon]|nr:AbrB/MazE/SpoVT family DNA-binding domain-containing protein [Nanoarchaeota archaeon]